MTAADLFARDAGWIDREGCRSTKTDLAEWSTPPPPSRRGKAREGCRVNNTAKILVGSPVNIPFAVLKV